MMRAIALAAAWLLCAPYAVADYWATTSQNSNTYSVPLGTRADGAPTDTSPSGSVKRCPVTVKPGVTAMFSCELVVEAPAPTPTPTPSPAPAPSLVFSTSFDMPAWNQSSGADPDPSSTLIGRHGDWGASFNGGTGDQITAAANRPGSSGNGFRHYRGVGTNSNGGGIKITLPNPVSEMWVRYYQRYSPGFVFSGGAPLYTKELYWNVGGSNILIFGYQGGAWGLNTQGATNIPSSVKWGGIDESQWHLFEYHVKQAGGVVEMWIDGQQVLSRTGVNIGTTPWGQFALGENQHDVLISGYTDYDDVAVSTVGRIGL